MQYLRTFYFNSTALQFPSIALKGEHNTSSNRVVQIVRNIPCTIHKQVCVVVMKTTFSDKAICWIYLYKSRETLHLKGVFLVAWNISFFSVFLHLTSTDNRDLRTFSGNGRIYCGSHMRTWAQLTTLPISVIGFGRSQHKGHKFSKTSLPQDEESMIHYTKLFLSQKASLQVKRIS